MPFVAPEREALLVVPGIGAGVIARLEAAGFDSIDSLRRAGVDEVIRRVCAQTQAVAWGNRRRALARVVASLVPAGAEVVASLAVTSGQANNH
jgi:hypothetical protein